MVLRLSKHYIFTNIVYVIKIFNHGCFRVLPKERFPLGAYQKIKKQRIQDELEKKLETDAKINELKNELIEKNSELKRLEEKLRRKKRKVSKY